jgi:hypothetical protein
MSDLQERLTKVESSDCGQGGFTTNWYRNPDGPEAAERISQLEAEVGRLKAERLKLDRRIHNQRVALQENWEIVEKRAGWLKGWPLRNRYMDLALKERRLRLEVEAQLRALSEGRE